MPIDFPTPSTVGETITRGSKTYTWTGEQWSVTNVIVSPTFSSGSADQRLTYDAVQQEWVNQRPFPTWNSTPATSATNNQIGDGFANWQRALTDVIRNNRDISGDRVTTPSGTYGSNFQGVVLLNDGRVFCVPRNTTSALIYDPVTNTTTIPSPVFSGGHLGGVLLPNGKVFCIPYLTSSPQIYDPLTDTLFTSSTTMPVKSVIGAVLLNNGKVFCSPHGNGSSSNSGSAYIYDYTTDSMSVVGGFNTGTAVYDGPVLLPDGRVYCIPGNTTIAKIYNPATNSVTTPTGTFSGTFNGGVLLPNGKVYCFPWTSTTARIYDPITDTLTIPNGTYVGGLANGQGVLLPNGKVMCFANNGTTACIYDPVTDTLVTANGTYSGGSGGVLLLSGKVFCLPSSGTSARIYDPTDSYQPITLDGNFVTSPFVNKY